ncbi:MAG: G5 domain-containing protein [Defluviitaleaceae bacterium]|nr:G5 domain-containing protein [Defluviitaleaceae bacterium]
MSDLKPLPKPVSVQKYRDAKNKTTVKAVPHQEILENSRRVNRPYTYQPPQRDRQSQQKQHYSQRVKPKKSSPVKRQVAKVYRFIKKGGGRIIGIATAFIVATSIIMWLVWSVTHHNAYAVYVGEERISYIAMSEDVDLDTLRIAVSNYIENDINAQIRINEEIRISPVNSSQQNITEFEYAVNDLVNYHISFQIVASAIYVNGIQEAILRNVEEAREVENRLLTRFTTNLKEHYHTIGFNERDFSIRTALVNEEDLISMNEAIAGLSRNTPGLRSHIVQSGQNLLNIANSYGIDLEELLEYNPHVSEHGTLSVGTELFIQYEHPLLPVVTVESISRREAIPLEIEERVNPDLYRGSQQTTRYGSAGEQELVIHITRINGRPESEVIVSEREVRAMITQIVEIGTRVADPNRR